MASSEQITRTIMECVRECRYTRSEVVEQTCERMKFKFPQKVVTMVTALVTAGSIDTSSGICKPGSGVQFEATGSDDGAAERINEMQVRINALENDLKESGKLREQLKNKMEEVIKAAKEGIDTANKRAEAAGGKIIEVQVKSGPKIVRKIKATFHKRFNRILCLAKMRKHIFIYGPTGCGKTHVCRQIADALNLPYYFVSCTTGMSEGKLEGRLLPVGKQGTFEYVIGEFVKAYETGGVFLLDEMDAADPNVLLVINSALANGRMAVPNRPKKPYAEQHKDFVCIAAANTVGTGADRLYSGRNKLDAATMDRFAVGKVFLDYDPEIELQMCPVEEVRVKLLKYRENIRVNRLERCVSTRLMRDAYDMMYSEDLGEADRWTFENVEESLFQSWREDEIVKVAGREVANRIKGR